MSIFLTGVTGYLGGAIAEALQRSGYMVPGLVRSEKSAKVLCPANIYGRAGPRHVHISSHAREQIYRKGRDT